ncbi:Rhomboid-related protein 2 [Halocaridina rubra]|uniref:Rhomboid-related protein 2 n=1 Tax=Halocaridina rubra TaxID=373956 RepID=A0AAN9A8Q7_HALRR
MSRRDNRGEHIPLRNLVKDVWDPNDPDRSGKISCSKLKERILHSEAADNVPNSVIIQLLRKADENADGYIDFDEFQILEDTVDGVLTPRRYKKKDMVSHAALAVVPRSERTLDKRSYIEAYSCCPPPIIMILAALAEFVTFVYYWVDMDQPMTASGPAPTYSPLIYNPFRRYECWRYITYALIHSGYMHLITNLIVQTFLGIILEMVHGWWRVGVIYLAGVFFGSLAHSITSPKSYLAGASGGVYAIQYAHLGNMIMNWSEMQYRWLQLVLILLISTWDFGYAIYDTYFSSTPSNTGHMAHFGGAIAGILVGIYILRNLEEKKWEKYCWWVAFTVFFILVGIGIILNIALPVPEFFPDNDMSKLYLARLDFLSRTT